MKMSEFNKRRKRLMRKMGKGSIAILPTASVKQRNSDVEHLFRPDSDFLYLTGFDEPETVAVLRPGHKDAEFILFCRERDPEKELWDGLRAGTEGAKENFGADAAFPINELEKTLPGLLRDCKRVFYAMGSHPELDRQLPRWVKQVRQQARSGISGPQEFIALD